MRRTPHGRERQVRTPLIQDFFERQEWLPHDNPAVQALRRLVIGSDARAVPRRPSPMDWDRSARLPSSMDESQPDADVFQMTLTNLE